MLKGLAILLPILLALAAIPAYAGGAGLNPKEALADTAQESRARSLFKQLRCVVCQSESLDDSEADLARDMRQLVREQVAEGKTDTEIKAYLTTRYGEFVLLQPPVNWRTWSLWFGPFALLAVVLIFIVRMLRRARPAGEAALSPEEQKSLAALKLPRVHDLDR